MNIIHFSDSRSSDITIFDLHVIETILMLFKIELRLSSIIALILALTALQFVIQEFLPDSSYLTPVAQMIVTGYVTNGTLLIFQWSSLV